MRTAGQLSPASQRATGASLAAVALSLVCFGAVTLLHLLRTDLDPVQRMMSEYANGAHGSVMTAAFYAFGVACLALAFRLRTAVERRGLIRVALPLLALAGVGLLLSGAFEVGRAFVPDTAEETVHSTASISAFVALIIAMVLFSGAANRQPPWSSFAPLSWLLSLIAAAAAMASPLLDGSPWGGVVQRVLGGAVLAWVLLTARRIRWNAFHAGP